MKPNNKILAALTVLPFLWLLPLIAICFIADYLTVATDWLINKRWDFHYWVRSRLNG